MSKPMIKHFKENKIGRDFIIADLHGCYDMLMALLKDPNVQFDKTKDRLFSVGDLIDRGPDSQKCLSLLYEPWFHAVKGNHENMLEIIVQEGGDWHWWKSNGGAWAEDVPLAELKEYASKINELPFAISVGEGEKRFNIVHAEFYGADEDLDRGDYDSRAQMQMLWGRSIWEDKNRGAKHPGLSNTFCGHTIHKTIVRNGSFCNLDMGAFLGSADSGLIIIEPREPRVTIHRGAVLFPGMGL